MCAVEVEVAEWWRRNSDSVSLSVWSSGDEGGEEAKEPQNISLLVKKG